MLFLYLLLGNGLFLIFPNSALHISIQSYAISLNKTKASFHTSKPNLKAMLSAASTSRPDAHSTYRRTDCRAERTSVLQPFWCRSSMDLLQDLALSSEKSSPFSSPSKSNLSHEHGGPHMRRAGVRVGSVSKRSRVMQTAAHDRPSTFQQGITKHKPKCSRPTLRHSAHY